ncbi:hypothetical protein [Paraburkholderia kirstenboschensis]|uniref:Uncharacterized protein n=1 Tax=Paraburkholderia kirstenboschensis TaxID=1245436 RepID=A0ABZ0ECC1_9BURK|nr:hypothetical protein [Paraburkholderia kirstenboschensis]WOD14159.1 hypothetical protein RW095_01140 [Paraburkholderia kirstenboschensis]
MNDFLFKYVEGRLQSMKTSFGCCMSPSRAPHLLDVSDLREDLLRLSRRAADRIHVGPALKCGFTPAR